MKVSLPSLSILIPSNGLTIEKEETFWSALQVNLSLIFDWDFIPTNPHEIDVGLTQSNK